MMPMSSIWSVNEAPRLTLVAAPRRGAQYLLERRYGIEMKIDSAEFRLRQGEIVDLARRPTP